MALKKWQSVLSGSEVSLTWPYSHDLVSRGDLEAQIKLCSFLSQGQHSSVDSIHLTISGQKNILNLMAEFGFISTVVEPKQTLTQYDGSFRNDRRVDICAGAAIMLSDKFWFDNVSDSVTEPFRFAGGCILPPNQLVIKYMSALSPQNQSDDDKEEEEEL